MCSGRQWASRTGPIQCNEREWQGQVNLRLKTTAATAKSIQPTANTQSEIGAIGQEGVRGEMGRSGRRWAKWECCPEKTNNNRQFGRNRELVEHKCKRYITRLERFSILVCVGAASVRSARESHQSLVRAAVYNTQATHSKQQECPFFSFLSSLQVYSTSNNNSYQIHTNIQTNTDRQASRHKQLTATLKKLLPATRTTLSKAIVEEEVVVRQNIRRKI